MGSYKVLFISGIRVNISKLVAGICRYPLELLGIQRGFVFIFITLLMIPHSSSFSQQQALLVSGVRERKDSDHVPFVRTPRNGSTYVIAHRGAHTGIPENTLAAYRKAIRLGCDFVEIDVRRTKDGRFVSMHNARVDKYVKGVTGKVANFTLVELKKMDIGSRVGPQWKNERIPAFEEILELCKGKIGIYLDLKEPYVKELTAILKDYGMERDVVWYIPASRMDLLKEVKKDCPSCIPMPDPGPAENIPAVAKVLHPEVMATDMGQLNGKYIRWAHERNIKVFVDEDKGGEEEWMKILKWGTDGIQTDDPERLIGFLKGVSLPQGK